MARFAFAVVVLSFLVRANAEEVAPVTTNVWQEAVISVTDLERTAKFFKQVAGYDERWRGPISDSELASFGLPESASGDALLLGHADHPSGLVRLVRFESVAKKEPMRPGARAWDTGCYFSLMVRAKNLDKLYDEAIQMGWWTETPITPLTFGESKLNIVVFQGPDGVQVQAYERLAPPLPESVGEFDRMSRPFNIMQMVDERDEAYRFFTEVLGFETWFGGDPYLAKQPEYSPIGIPYSLTTSVRYHAGIVYPKSGEFGRMEMIEVMDIDGRDHSKRCDAPNLGILAVRFHVDDAASAMAEIKRRGWPIERGIINTKISPYGQLKLFSVKTPDGAIISFYE